MPHTDEKMLCFQTVCQRLFHKMTLKWTTFQTVRSSQFLFFFILCSAMCHILCALTPKCYLRCLLFSLFFISCQCFSDEINDTSMAAGSSHCKMLLKRCLEFLHFKVLASFPSICKMCIKESYFLYPCEKFHNYVRQAKCSF